MPNDPELFEEAENLAGECFRLGGIMGLVGDNPVGREVAQALLKASAIIDSLLGEMQRHGLDRAGGDTLSREVLRLNDELTTVKTTVRKAMGECGTSSTTHHLLRQIVPDWQDGGECDGGD